MEGAVDNATRSALQKMGTAWGGDTYILKKILHDWNDDRARDVLATCRRAMAGSARLLIIEHLVCAPNQFCQDQVSDIQMMVQRRQEPDGRGAP